MHVQLPTGLVPCAVQWFEQVQKHGNHVKYPRVLVSSAAQQFEEVQ